MDETLKKLTDEYRDAVSQFNAINSGRAPTGLVYRRREQMKIAERNLQDELDRRQTVKKQKIMGKDISSALTAKFGNVDLPPDATNKIIGMLGPSDPRQLVGPTTPTTPVNVLSALKEKATIGTSRHRKKKTKKLKTRKLKRKHHK